MRSRITLLFLCFLCQFAHANNFEVCNEEFGIRFVVNVTNMDQGTSNGSLTLDIIDGTPQFHIEVQHDNQLIHAFHSTSRHHTFSGLTYGWYIIEVDWTAPGEGDVGTAFYLDLAGCSDPTALNYNPNVTFDDGSCQYQQEQCPNILGIFSHPPTCPNDNDGWIEIESQGTSLLYSLDGANFQSSNRFENLYPGTYTPTAKNSVLNCSDN